MKFIPSKYDLGDTVLLEGTCLEIERILTITSVHARAKKDELKVWYGFKESLWMHEEEDILKKVSVTGS